jgi:hypothetical protein
MADQFRNMIAKLKTVFSYRNNQAGVPMNEIVEHFADGMRINAKQSENKVQTITGCQAVHEALQRNSLAKRCYLASGSSPSIVNSNLRLIRR